MVWSGVGSVRGEGRSVAPKAKTHDSVYSNFDHQLDGAVVAQLLANPDLCAQHAAWNFCGYVWHADGQWHEEVWQFNDPVKLLSGDDLDALIAGVNDEFGCE